MKGLLTVLRPRASMQGGIGVQRCHGSLHDFSSASCSSHCYPRIPAELRFLPSPTPTTCSTPIGTTIERFFAASSGQHGKTDAPPVNARSSPRVAGRTQPSIHASGEKRPPAHGRTGVSPLHNLHSSPLDTPRQHEHGRLDDDRSPPLRHAQRRSLTRIPPSHQQSAPQCPPPSPGKPAPTHIVASALDVHPRSPCPAESLQCRPRRCLALRRPHPTCADTCAPQGTPPATARPGPAAAPAAACAGPGRAVTGGVHWGVRSVCAGGVRARPRRGRVSAGGHLGARCCCAGGMRVRWSRCARRSGGLRPSSSQRARMLAGCRGGWSAERATG